MTESSYRLEMGLDKYTHLTHWGLLFYTPEAALIELTTDLHEDGLYTGGVSHYRCVEFNPETDEHIRVVWKLEIMPKKGEK